MFVFKSIQRAVLALACTAVFFSVAAHGVAADDFPPQAALDALAQQRGKHINGDEAVNGLAQDCLGFLTAGGDANLKRAGEIAHVLIARADTDRDGIAGWGLNADETEVECAGPGSMPGFKPGTCDGAGTAEMYRTGLAMSCLARYGAASGDRSAINAAKRAADESWNLGSADVPCKDCFTYWPTYSVNDANRYVRNRSVLMGMGLAWLSKATHDPRYAQRARAVARADAWEIAQGNRGYFSKLDPKYIAAPALENARVENHTPLVAKGLLDIGRVLNDPTAVKNAGVVIDQWISCDTKQCETKPCKYYAGDLNRCRVPDTLRSCLIRSASAKASAHCARASSQIPDWGPETLWYVFDAKN